MLLLLAAPALLGCAAGRPAVVRFAPGNAESLDCAEAALSTVGFAISRGPTGSVVGESRSVLGPARARRDFVTVERIDPFDGEGRIRVTVASYSYEPPPVESRMPRQQVGPVAPSTEALAAGERVLASCAAP